MRLRNLKPYKLNKAIIELDDERNQTIVGYEEIGTIMADVQPCKCYVKAMQYGQEITKYLSVMIDPRMPIKSTILPAMLPIQLVDSKNISLLEGMYIEVEKNNYKIGAISRWRHWEFDIEAVI